MDISLANKTIKIAQNIRNRCERYARSGRSYPKHYHEQNDLRCMCATASAALYEALNKEGIKSQFCNGHYDCGSTGEDFSIVNHCWIEIDKKIIDITATQFGAGDRIFVAEADSSIYGKINEVDSWQTMEWQWPQKPTPAIVNEIIGTEISNQTLNESFRNVNTILESILN